MIGQSEDNNTREPERRPAGVEYEVYRSWTVVQTRLQFDRFNLSDESLVVVGKERTDHVEHGITEATDIHDVSALTSLNGLVRLQMNHGITERLPDMAACPGNSDLDGLRADCRDSDNLVASDRDDLVGVAAK